MLIDSLDDVIDGLNSGSIEIKTAESIINASGKIIKALMVKLVAEKSGSQIEYLKESKCLKP